MDFPVTLYKEDVRKLTQPTNKVLAIFRKEYNEQYYSECTYFSKEWETSKDAVSEDIKRLFEAA